MWECFQGEHPLITWSGAREIQHETMELGGLKLKPLWMTSLTSSGVMLSERGGGEGSWGGEGGGI